MGLNGKGQALDSVPGRISARRCCVHLVAARTRRGRRAEKNALRWPAPNAAPRRRSANPHHDQRIRRHVAVAGRHWHAHFAQAASDGSFSVCFMLCQAAAGLRRRLRRRARPLGAAGMQQIAAGRSASQAESISPAEKHPAAAPTQPLVRPKRRRPPADRFRRAVAVPAASAAVA